MKRKHKQLLPNKYLNQCVYCGFPATVREHFMPCVHHESPLWIPSCKRCNELLGTCLVDTLAERAEKLKTKYLIKYKHLDGYNYEELLEDTRGSLKRRFEKEHEQQKALYLKIKWLDFLILISKGIDLWLLKPHSRMLDKLCEVLDTIFESQYSLA
jgi:hypothetical protein